MGTRFGLVTIVLASFSAARADTVTLEPTKLALTPPTDWKVMSERAGDFLHHENEEERTIDLSFERAATCRAWRAEPGRRKEFPAYWPKRARTHLYTKKGDGKILSSGCLADSPGGALIAHLEITVADPKKWKPTADDVETVREVLAAALAGAKALAAPATTTNPDPAESSTRTPPAPPTPVVLGPSSHRGGETVTLPQLDLAVKLPKDAVWIVGVRGESKIERDNAAAGALVATVLATPFRSCREWRVDGAASDASTYFDRLGYLPANTGAFATASVTSACLDTKAGPLGFVLEHAKVPEGADAQLVRNLVEAIVAAGNKSRRPIFSGTATLEAGMTANANIGKVTLPVGAQWRVTNGTIERFDKGRYFAVSTMSRPRCAARAEATASGFWPANLAATLETRGGATISKACLQAGARAIELTLVYDGAIAAGDHALIRSLIDAIVAAANAKKPKT